MVCGGCKATRYCKKSCQFKDWQNDKAICLAIQILSENIYENELGKGDSEDKQAFVSHLTPKDQVKVSILVVENSESPSVDCEVKDSDEPSIRSVTLIKLYMMKTSSSDCIK